MVFKKLKITINMKKKFRFMLKKILFGFLIIMFLNPSTLQAANYPFDYLLCDSLKNANYNFGIENRKNKLIIHKLKNNNIKKSTVYLSKDNKINLSEKNFFDNNIYLSLGSKKFFDAKTNEFLGGCFVVSNQTNLHCKLKSYYNVFNKKLPLECD